MAKLFSELIKDLREGALDLELSAELAAVVSAATSTNKMAKLTLTLGVKALQGGMVQIEDVIVTKVPEPERESTTYMYAGEDGDLSKRDPRQPKLPSMGVVGRIEQSGGG